MIFVGDDCAEDHHDVHVMDEAGLRLSAPRLPEGLTGIRPLHALIASANGGPQIAPGFLAWRRGDFCRLDLPEKTSPKALSKGQTGAG